jgi:hypothetical protein
MKEGASAVVRYPNIGVGFSTEKAPKYHYLLKQSAENIWQPLSLRRIARASFTLCRALSEL